MITGKLFFLPLYYTLAIMRVALLLKMGLLSSENILLRSTLYADFMHPLASEGDEPLGNNLSYNKIKTQEAFSSTYPFDN